MKEFDRDRGKFSVVGLDRPDMGLIAVPEGLSTEDADGILTMAKHLGAREARQRLVLAHVRCQLEFNKLLACRCLGLDYADFADPANFANDAEDDG